MLEMSYRSYSPSKTKENGYTWYECNCCPYGYHIDLDFVRYCESITQATENRTGSIKRRKDRRRQRQSMEVLLGLTPPVLAALEKNYKTIEEQNSPIVKTPTAKFSYSADGFDDAISDFEKTLQKSKYKLSNNLPDVTAVSASGSMTSLPIATDSSAHDLDYVSSEWCGMSPLALQNIREQMALSLERTKQLEDQVKLVPELKEQLASLQEENSRLLLRIKLDEPPKPNFNIQPQFTVADKPDSISIKKSTPPTKKDAGVMCSVLTRNIGVGHQNPNTKSVSTTTLEYDFGDKWLPEKVKFLNNQNLLFSTPSLLTKKLTVSKEIQTTLRRSNKDIGIQFESFSLPGIQTNKSTQTSEIKKIFNNMGVLAKARLTDVSIQKCMECYSIGCSDDTIDNVICERCNASKRTIAVGPDTNEDTHTSPVSLAALSSKSKSFHLGDNKLNFSNRINTSSQYERTCVSRSCQSDIKVKSYSKSCQFIRKTFDKITQYERNTISRITDTLDLIPPRRHVACEAKEMKSETNDVGCNTVADSLCARCDKEKEEAKDSFKKDGGSPTPSRIPRPQIPTTPVENRKFRRQDTYTKIESTSKDIPLITVSRFRFDNGSDLCPEMSPRLSGLGLSPSPTSKEANPFDKVKKNFKISSHVQNGVNSSPITKVQVQESTLPITESTVFQPSISQTRHKAMPSKEMQGAMKVLSDLLHKNPSKNIKNHSAVNIVQQEWFNISSLVIANPLDVEDYLDALEDMSSLLLEYVVNLSDSSGNTAMHYAVSHSNFDVVSILLDSKVCDINKQNKAGYTSVMLVSLAEVKSQTHANVVRRLFQLSDVNIRAKQHGQTALMLAVSHGHLDMVKMLLEAGADINIQDEDGSTALMCAAEHGHIEIVKHLLNQSDCDSLLTDVDGGTALKIAMEAGHRHIGVLLYAHERSIAKAHGSKLKKHKSMSPKTSLSPLPSRSSRALSDTEPK